MLARNTVYRIAICASAGVFPRVTARDRARHFILLGGADGNDVTDPYGQAALYGSLPTFYGPRQVRREDEQVQRSVLSVRNTDVTSVATHWTYDLMVCAWCVNVVAGNVIDPIDVIEGASLQQLLHTLENSLLHPREVAKYGVVKRKDFPQGLSICTHIRVISQHGPYTPFVQL